MRSGISGWVIGLLIRGRAGAVRRAANSWSPWSPVLADGEAAAAFLFGHSRSAVAELFGNSRSQSGRARPIPKSNRVRAQNRVPLEMQMGLFSQKLSQIKDESWRWCPWSDKAVDSKHSRL
jgi:hypothetical protein